MPKKKKKHGTKSYQYQQKAQDYHHHCFMARNWNNGWAKVLREHSYTGAYIPKFTLHHEIHETVRNVPTPDGRICRIIVEELNRNLENGVFSVDDKPMTKMQNLIEICAKHSPATASALEKQLEVMQRFYHANQ